MGALIKTRIRALIRQDTELAAHVLAEALEELLAGLPDQILVEAQTQVMQTLTDHN